MGKRKRRKKNKILIFIGELFVVGFVFFTVLLFASNIYRTHNGGEVRSNDQSQDSAKADDEAQQDTGNEDTGQELGFSELEITPEAGDDEEDTEQDKEEEPESDTDEEPLGDVPEVDLGGIRSSSAILIRLADDAVVAQLDADTKIAPGALTKVMTTLVALESADSLDDEIYIDNNWYNDLYVQGVSMAGFVPGDRVSVRDMLYGAFLASGSESCMGLALQYYDSEEAFVDAMNQKAQALGMDNTHFTSCLGLSDANHYTTVGDLAIMLSYALENEDFRTIFCASKYTTAPTSAFASGITFSNTMLSGIESGSVSDGEMEGGKTCYTSSSGLCLMGVASVQGEEYILVTAGAPGSSSSDTGHLLDAIEIFNKITAQ